MKWVHNQKILKERRKELRERSTDTEEFLWSLLRNKNLGVKFRRQHSFGGYILDFYCPDKKLIIELDGEIHTKKENREYDEVRDKFFKELGYVILRFSNKEIEKDINEVLAKITKTIDII